MRWHAQRFFIWYTYTVTYYPHLNMSDTYYNLRPAADNAASLIGYTYYTPHYYYLNLSDIYHDDLRPAAASAAPLIGYTHYLCL